MKRISAGWADAGALASYVLLAAWIVRDLVPDPARRLLYNQDDNGFFLAMMAHGERVVFHGDSPLFTTRLNFPDGVNLMANTSMLAVSIPLAPVTHLYGPGLTLVLLIVLGLAGTAAAWWWLLSRHLVDSRPAAWIGGLWAGFAPGFVAHANGQPNFTAGFVVPFIVWQVIRLREPGRTWRGGALLGILIAVQVFVNEEFLLLLAIALALVAVGFVFSWRQCLPGLLVAAGVAVVLLAYPLHFQFFGRGHYSGVPFRVDQYATPLGSIAAYPRRSLAGSEALARQVTGGSLTEDAMFWGPGICLMVIVSVALLWRSMAARALAFAGFVLLVMSFGSELRATRTRTLGPAPLGWTEHVPLLDLVTTPRFALATTTIAGVLLALAADRARQLPRPGRGAFWAGMALALVPMFPQPLPTSMTRPVPAFFAQQMWRPYLKEGQSVVMVPLPAMITGRDSMRIAAVGNLAFPTPRGYFLGPVDPPRDNTGTWFGEPRYTVTLIEQIRTTGVAPILGADEHRAIRADLNYWRAGIVVLLPRWNKRTQVRSVLTEVLGPPIQVGDVEVWPLNT
ncbi:DUF2079 domain-containing protein [Paractinoplanes toevensis]|uniref:DUF2079 domain-containing protein n=1 Tax=Paractinoplanes toevensis TaxID=571911 RepID=UPI001FE8DBCB|nr:DUF2079 domain-containing protein [Actinoplanes toevensis]